MKVSTMHPHHASGMGVIILYCGPTSDEARCKKIGAVILSETGYTNPSRKMFYKTDVQTLSKKGGHHKYQLDIPQSNFDVVQQSTHSETHCDDQKMNVTNTSDTATSSISAMAPTPGIILSTAPPPIPVTVQMSRTAVVSAPVPVPDAVYGSTVRDKDGDDKEAQKYQRIMRSIKKLGFQRIVLISRHNFEMMAHSSSRLDSAEKWRQRIEQQSVLNGRQKMVVLHWFRTKILEGQNRFNYQLNWDFPDYILNLITLHYLENIDDKEQLLGDWADNYKPCFYFFQEKWNILLRESSQFDQETQSLVCLKGRNECLIAKQFSKFWVICKVRVMGRRQMNRNNVSAWNRYHYSSAPHAYNTLQSQVFDDVL